MIPPPPTPPPTLSLSLPLGLLHKSIPPSHSKPTQLTPSAPSQPGKRPSQPSVLSTPLLLKASPALGVASLLKPPRRTRTDLGVSVQREGVASRCLLAASLLESLSLFFGPFGRSIFSRSCFALLPALSLLCFNPSFASSSLLLTRRAFCYLVSLSFPFLLLLSHVRSLSLFITSWTVAFLS